MNRRDFMISVCAAALTAAATTTKLSAAPNIDLFNLNTGQWLVCRNGHRVAQVTQHINSDTINWGECIGNWRVRPPKIGQSFNMCLCWCGANYTHSRPYLITEDYYLVHGWPAEEAGHTHA